MFKPTNRRQSVPEKEKLSKKSNKKKKKGKKSRTTSGEEVENQQVATDCDQSADSPDGAQSLKNGSRFPLLSAGAEATSSAPGSATVGNLSAPSQRVVSVHESPSVNTDLSESTISLLSSTGNSHTDLPGQTVVTGAYCSPVDTLVQSLTELSVKIRANGVTSESPRSSRTAKIQQQKSQGVQSSRKTSGSSKPKNSAVVASQNGKSYGQKSKSCDDKSNKTDKGAKSVVVSNTDSLRWEMVLDDSDEERERIRTYKAKRRKRYLADAEAKGLAWASEYSERGTPRLSSMDTVDERREVTQNFSAMQSLAPVTVHTVRGKIIVEG